MTGFPEMTETARPIAQPIDRAAVASSACGKPETWTISIERLQAAIEGYGRIAYLLTVGGDGQPHCTAVMTTWMGEALVAAPGRKSLTNATARPRVTLLWPPPTWGEHSLILDAEATVCPGPDREPFIEFRPVRVVRHPTPDPADGTSTSVCEAI
jgi:hypothetical protein